MFDLYLVVDRKNASRAIWSSAANSTSTVGRSVGVNVTVPKLTGPFLAIKMSVVTDFACVGLLQKMRPRFPVAILFLVYIAGIPFRFLILCLSSPISSTASRARLLDC